MIILLLNSIDDGFFGRFSKVGFMFGRNLVSIVFSCMTFTVGCDRRPAIPDTRTQRVAANLVANDVNQYQGRTLISDLRLHEVAANGIAQFQMASGDAKAFSLRSPSPEMTDKLTNADRLAGKMASVIVTYKIDDSATKDSDAIGTIIDVSAR